MFDKIKSVDDKKPPAEVDEAEEAEVDSSSNKNFIIVIAVMVLLLVLATVDSFTTHYFKRMCNALAVWTMANAPMSFIAFEFIILIFLVLCLPYGPLGVLSGALFFQKYGKVGIFVAGVLLCAFTLAGAAIAFLLARYKFKDTVQKMISKQPKLKFLKNLDRLIQGGQGIEMVVLIRLAPFPKGPTNYFLGTTSVTWNEFLIGSIIVNLPMSFVDVCIGAGASNVKMDNPVSIVLFVVAILAFVCLICYVGGRAKRKLNELDDEDNLAEANNELDVLAVEDEEAPQGSFEAKGGDTSKKGADRAVVGGSPAASISDDSDDNQDDIDVEETRSGREVTSANEKYSDEVEFDEDDNENATLLNDGDKAKAAPGPQPSHQPKAPPPWLEAVGDLQIVGKPNAWLWPDPRLNLGRTTNHDGGNAGNGGQSVVDTLTVQLTSPSFSFQLVSASAGWSLRVFPRDAAPSRMGMLHASVKGVLKEEDPSAVVCASADGIKDKATGHGHNFHVVEATGDVVKIFVRRSLKDAGEGSAPLPSPNSQLETVTNKAQSELESVRYEVWYEVVSRGVCKDPAKAKALEEEKRFVAEEMEQNQQQQQQQQQQQGDRAKSGATLSAEKPKPPRRMNSKRVKATITDFEPYKPSGDGVGDSSVAFKPSFSKLSSSSAPVGSSFYDEAEAASTPPRFFFTGGDGMDLSSKRFIKLKSRED